MRKLGLVGLFAAMALLGQSEPGFEVASVKASTSGFNGVRGGCRGIDTSNNPSGMAAKTPLGRCVITDGRLSHLIGIAFDLPGLGTIKNAPDWVMGGDERFTIEAKVEDPTKVTEEQMRRMLQALLVERFQLKFHWEEKDVAGFALVVGKNGSKLQETKNSDTSSDFGSDFKPNPAGAITFNARKYSMAKLANMISQVGPARVIDKTELKGDYDFRLSWDETAGPSLVTAVQEQLGLRLEPHKVPMSFFVIESAERPRGN